MENKIPVRGIFSVFRIDELNEFVSPLPHDKRINQIDNWPKQDYFINKLTAGGPQWILKLLPKNRKDWEQETQIVLNPSIDINSHFCMNVLKARLTICFKCGTDKILITSLGYSIPHFLSKIFSICLLSSLLSRIQVQIAINSISL